MGQSGCNFRQNLCDDLPEKEKKKKKTGVGDLAQWVTHQKKTKRREKRRRKNPQEESNIQT